MQLRILAMVLDVSDQLAVTIKRSQDGRQQINNNNNIYLLQLGCHPVAVVILHVYKILN